MIIVDTLCINYYHVFNLIRKVDLTFVKRTNIRTQRPVGNKAVRIRIRPEASHLSTTNSTGDARFSDPGISDQPRSSNLQGLYIISVAARLLHMHPQTLRKYERLGLVRPSRIIGAWRLYSDEDIEKLRLIKHLADEVGLNLAGVEIILRLLEHLIDMRHRIAPTQKAERFQRQIEQELEQLFQNLNLPLQIKVPIRGIFHVRRTK